MPQVVLITGASSGIGLATAELMARRGWHVAATARDVSALEELPHVAAFPLDVTSETSMTSAVADVVSRFGGIDVLVNNAGYGVFGPLEGTPSEEVERQLRTNLLGSIAMIRHVMPIMRAAGRGTIVNVSSIGGRTAAPFASLYHASKFAIEGFSESFRYEAALHGIRVKLVEPGHFKTSFLGRSLYRAAHPAYDGAFDNYMTWVDAEDRRAPLPDPVAETITRAAGDASPRLRYPVRSAAMLAITRLLPDVVWRRLLAAGLTRRRQTR
jgi:NAD(P)-dependent dehydrogenase (short-subunit alcohol dehydrogenase family)